VAALIVLYVVIGAAALVAIVRSFFLRRHGEAQLPADGWQRTDEIFIDPTTNRRMRVWLDPADNSRHYVAEG
jgi:cell division protein FtsW (lipid II flippase)